MLELLKKHLYKNNLLPPKSRLVVGVSGGVDSVALLDLLSKLQSYFGWHISVAHLDHKVRPNSYKDAIFVSNLADKYGHKFFLGQLDGSKSDEASLREYRHHFFNQILSGTNSDYIVLAHHRDDRLETAIFNIIRGANRDGHNSLKAKRGVAIRPLLNFTKAEIIVYANLENLNYLEDSTNDDVNYSRNLIRYNLTPLASTISSDYKDNFFRSLDNIAELNHRIDWMLSEVFSKIAKITDDSIEFDRRAYSKLSSLVRINLLAYGLKKMINNLGLTSQVLKRVDDIIAKNHKIGNFDVVSSLKLLASYDKFIITFAPDITSDAIAPVSILDNNKPITTESFRISLNTDPKNSNYQIFTVKPSKFYVRNWQAGDKIYPIGLGGSKKIQDIFVDKKISRNLRSSWPVIVNEKNQVVWLVNLAKDKRFLADANPKYNLVCEVI